MTTIDPSLLTQAAQYRVECQSGTRAWLPVIAGSSTDVKAEAEAEKRKLEAKYPGHMFRVVTRNVAPWRPLDPEATESTNLIPDLTEEMTSVVFDATAEVYAGSETTVMPPEPMANSFLIVLPSDTAYRITVTMED